MTDALPMRDEGDPLANPIWHALGEQTEFAETNGRVRRYDPDVSVFCALPDDPTPDDWDALRALVGPGGSAFLIGNLALPNGWTKTFELGCTQMVLDALTPGSVPEHVTLTDADVPEMTDLVARTEPGPWRPRTVEFGGYVGVRDNGNLVAMAGRRMRPPGYVEISAVCTDPAYRGRGLAGGLTRIVANGIAAEGNRPMLHAATRNTGAVRLYESLGFRITRTLDAVALTAPA
jgi:ribosomal protein S18 acetylase RimI-like enzyme